MAQLVSKLSSKNQSTREAALISLADHPAEKVIPRVAQMLVDDSSPHAQSACLDLLERYDAVFNLGDVRADDWFDQMGKQITNFDKICELMGKNILAYSIILGVQIKALTKDPIVPANTTVEFAGDDNLIQTLPLSEFQVRVVQTLIRLDKPVYPKEMPLNDRSAVKLIGQAFTLVAPLFDISLKRLIWVPGDPGRGVIGFISSAGFNFMDLDEYRAFLRQKLHRELVGVHEEPFQLDLTAIDLAHKAAEEGDHEKVISILETWPGLLASLQRSPAVHQLNDQQLSMIAEGLVMLGDAFRTKGRLTWAEELYRLGLQFLREGDTAAKLFHRLGLLMNHTERHGEAIGLLRRARSLGVDDREVFPALGKAFLHRGKAFAAALLLEVARERGVQNEEIESDFEDAKSKLKQGGVSWPLFGK